MPLVEDGPTNPDIESDLASFQDLLLPEPIVRALNRAGFRRPSPVQRLAIPLGRFGADILVQAKSGTGKTLTYGTILTELVSSTTPKPQALVIEPTRELAFQTVDVIAALLKDLPQALYCAAFVGGLPFLKDAQRLREGPCQIVVGTPGRLRALVDSGDLLPAHIRSVVLDEADSLLVGEGFLEDIASIIRALPEKKQVMAFSATYTPDILREATAIMHDPQPVLLCPQTTALQGIRQLYSLVGNALDGVGIKVQRLRALLSLLDRIAFDQAIVFTNDRDWAEEVAATITERGLSAAFLSGGQSQRKRMSIVASMRRFRLRILVATDLAARGLDVPQVNLVVNLDLPRDFATYMHRIGRTGRFGKRGVAVSCVTGGELDTLQRYLEEGSGGSVEPAPALVPSGWYAQADPGATRQHPQGVVGPASAAGGDGNAGAEASGAAEELAVGASGDGELWALANGRWEDSAGIRGGAAGQPEAGSRWEGGAQARPRQNRDLGEQAPLQQDAAPERGHADATSKGRGLRASGGGTSSASEGPHETPGGVQQGCVADTANGRSSGGAGPRTIQDDFGAGTGRREAGGWGADHQRSQVGGPAAAADGASWEDGEKQRQVSAWRRMYYSYWWWEMLRRQQQGEQAGGRGGWWPGS